MVDALCVRTCYDSSACIRYKKDRVYQVDEVLYKEMDFLKYFQVLESATRVQALVGAAAKAAAGSKNK